MANCNAGKAGDVAKEAKKDIRREAVERLARYRRCDEKAARDVASTLQYISDDLKNQEISKEIDIYKALADESRLLILKLLMDGELCFCEIMTALKKAQPSTSYHLSLLKRAGLIKDRQEGRWTYYRLSDGVILEIMKQIKVLNNGRH